MSQESVAKALQLGLYVGAARADLSPAGVAVLRQELAGPLEDYRAGRYDEDDIIDIVDQVMPDGWQPTEEWSAALEAAGFTRGCPGK